MEASSLSKYLEVIFSKKMIRTLIQEGGRRIAVYPSPRLEKGGASLLLFLQGFVGHRHCNAVLFSMKHCRLTHCCKETWGSFMPGLDL